MRVAPEDELSTRTWREGEGGNRVGERMIWVVRSKGLLERVSE